jgi:hypothetical protein
MPRHLFIVSRDHQELYTYLTERFADDPKVSVILDRRVGERRRVSVPVAVERRQADRRQRPEIDAEIRTRSYAIVTVS